MRKVKKTFIMPLSFILGVLLIFGGCSAAKKPGAPTPQAPPTPRANAVDQANSVKVAEKVAAEARRVEGVRTATAAALNQNIYLGLELNPTTAKEKTAEIENTVLQRVKKIEPNFDIKVTSNADIVARIKKVAKSIRNGEPLGSYRSELKDIDERMKQRKM